METSMGPSTMESQVSPSEQAASTAKPPSTCFSCQRLNETTFFIKEDDKWQRNPLIYVKVYESVIVLLDTGCGGASKDPDIQLNSLREFIETYPVSVNGDKPLNPAGERGYVVICTNCHYDHIGGIEQFTDEPNSVIWASDYDNEFILDEPFLPVHSLCQSVGMKTPLYKVTHWAADEERITYGTECLDLGLVVYQAPGHTPDGLAVWDTIERVLFVGDIAHECAPILFPFESDIALYKETLTKLRRLVRELNTDQKIHANVPVTPSLENSSIGTSTIKRVRLASSHVTSDIDAEYFLDQVYDLLCKVEQVEVEPKHWRHFRRKIEVLFERDGSKISFAGPLKNFSRFVKNRDRMLSILLDAI